MKRNFVVSLFGSLVGFGMLFIVLSAFVTIAGAQTISRIKTFSNGEKFPDGTTQTTVFYQPELSGPGNISTTVDSMGDVGQYTSIAIGADGLGLISYYDVTNADLKVLHCGNAVCNSGTISTTLDSVGDVGQYTFITIGTDGLGLIIYYDVTNADLKVLHCGNTACTNGNISTTVDSVGDVGQDTSLTIGTDGLGLISYYDVTNRDLKVLHCGNAACNNGNTATTVDSAGNVGQVSSIIIGADGLGLISYHDTTNNGLKVLHCGNAACNSGNTRATVYSESGGVAVGYFTSLTIGADGLGLISFYDPTYYRLKVLHCGTLECDSGTAITLGSSSNHIGYSTSIAIGADGLGLISYSSYRTYTNFGLKVLHCGTLDCNSGNISTTVDSAGDVGKYASLAIGADGLGLISYYDSTNGDLKALHCVNAICRPYTHNIYLPLVVKNP